jgi:hypothetical protein
MIPPTIADEYPVRLSTGETIQVAELDEERSPALVEPRVRAAVEGLLQQCSFVSREIMEEAKAGYDTRFKAQIRSQPLGCMIKAEPHICRLINDCAMAFKPVCTLHNAMPFPKPLPICWEFDPPGTIDLEVRRAAVELGSIIGHAWRRGLYVFIVK